MFLTEQWSAAPFFSIFYVLFFLACNIFLLILVFLQQSLFENHAILV